MMYFTADLHFYHANVIKYSNRPFKDVTEMNRGIIKGINDTVGIDDTLWILGDFGFCKAGEALSILNQINCKNLHYVMGNHDKIMREPKIRSKFKSMDSYAKVDYEKQRFILFHYPILEWESGHHGTIHLHGHTHGNLTYPDALKDKKIFDVGVDVWDYKPVSAEHLIKLSETREKIIHHNRGETK